MKTSIIAILLSLSVSASAKDGIKESLSSWFLRMDSRMVKLPKDGYSTFHVGDKAVCTILPEQYDNSREMLCTDSEGAVQSILAMCDWSGLNQDRSSTMIVDGREVSIACEPK